MQFPLLCENSGTILLVLLGLTAGRPAGSPAGQQADQILVDLKNLKLSTDHTVRIFTAFNKSMLLS